jgi:hypothetical protein
MVDLADAEGLQRGPDPLRFPDQQADLVAPPDELGNGVRADEPRPPVTKIRTGRPSAYPDSAWTGTGLLVATMTQYAPAASRPPTVPHAIAWKRSGSIAAIVW